MANQTHFPLRLRQARIARGWSQMRLGAMVGLAQGDVSAIETGRRRAGALRRHRLAMVFGLPVAVLFSRADLEVPDSAAADWSRPR